MSRGPEDCARCSVLGEEGWAAASPEQTRDTGMGHGVSAWLPPLWGQCRLCLDPTGACRGCQGATPSSAVRALHHLCGPGTGPAWRGLRRMAASSRGSLAKDWEESRRKAESCERWTGKVWLVSVTSPAEGSLQETSV